MFSVFLNIFRAKQSILNISSTHFVTLVSTISSIILTPFILHRVGSEQYALWVILNALMSYFSFTRLGFATKMCKDLSEQSGHDEQKIINSFLFAVLLIQFILIPLVLSAAYWLKLFVKIDDAALFGRTVVSFYLLYLAFVISLAANVFNTMFYSRSKHYLVNVLVSLRIFLNV